MLPYSLALVATLMQAATPPFNAPDPTARVEVTSGVWTARERGCPTLPIDALLRQRMVDVATAEWRRFNFPVTDHRKRDLMRVVVPDSGPLIPAKFNAKMPGIARQALRLGWMEDDRQVRRAIGGYWTSVPGQNALQVQSVIFAQFPDAGWAHPWSAAFLSYVMCSAGVGDMEKFQRADGHWAYVDQAIATADGAANGIFKATDVDSGLPAPGDFICADRADTEQPYRNLADRRGKTGFRAMHCDLVVRVVAGKRGYVAAIGGNVVQAVSMTLVSLRPGAMAGTYRLETAADIPSARPWFTILRLQAPGSALLEASPAVRSLPPAN